MAMGKAVGTGHQLLNRASGGGNGYQGLHQFDAPLPYYSVKKKRNDVLLLLPAAAFSHAALICGWF